MTPNKELKEKLAEQNLSLEEAVELVKNRHFIAATKDDVDLFPYDFSLGDKRLKAKDCWHTSLCLKPRVRSE